MPDLLSIDPGPEFSAYVEWVSGAPARHAKIPTWHLVTGIATRAIHGRQVCIEMIASFGMAVGAEVFETCVNIGQIMQAAAPHAEVHRLPRIQIKTHLCHSARAKDANVRQALIDRFGGKDKAIGTKKAPGPLYGVSGDVWAALAVGCAHLDGVRWKP